MWANSRESLELNPLDFLLRSTVPITIVRIQSACYITIRNKRSIIHSGAQVSLEHLRVSIETFSPFEKRSSFANFPTAPGRASSGRYFQWDQVNLVWWWKENLQFTSFVILSMRVETISRRTEKGHGIDINYENSILMWNLCRRKEPSRAIFTDLNFSESSLRHNLSTVSGTWGKIKIEKSFVSTSKVTQVFQYFITNWTVLSRRPAGVGAFLLCLVVPIVFRFYRPSRDCRTFFRILQRSANLW